MPISAESQLRRPVGAYMPVKAGFSVTRTRRRTRTAPVWSVTDMRDDSKTINCSGVYIYNYVGLWISVFSCISRFKCFLVHRRFCTRTGCYNWTAKNCSRCAACRAPSQSAWSFTTCTRRWSTRWKSTGRRTRSSWNNRRRTWWFGSGRRVPEDFVSFKVAYLLLHPSHSRRVAEGPSIKYVTLQGGGGLRKCDSLWQGRGVKITWRHTFNFFTIHNFTLYFIFYHA